MAQRLRTVRLVGALQVISITLAADSPQELKAHLLAPAAYLAFALAFVLASSLSRRRFWWSLWAVPFVDVPFVLAIEYGRVTESSERLGNAMYALGLFAFMVLMALMTTMATSPLLVVFHHKDTKSTKRAESVALCALCVFVVNLPTEFPGFSASAS